MLMSGRCPAAVLLWDLDDLVAKVAPDAGAGRDLGTSVAGPASVKMTTAPTAAKKQAQGRGRSKKPATSSMTLSYPCAG